MTTPETNDTTATTGHEWDGIEELDNPLPRWWLMILYASIVWSIGFWILYPAWPLIGGYTKGMLGYSSRAELAAEVAAVRVTRQVFVDRIAKADLADVIKDPELLEFAMAGGKSAFGDNCAGCHGVAAQGAKGYPNLSDDDWLWGGALEDIHQTILYGIRSTHDETRTSDMPAFGKDEILNQAEISSVADFVLSLSQPGATANEKGAAVFEENCVDCHGPKGRGNREFGAPNLADAIWLFGRSKEDIVYMVTNSRRSVMPKWVGRLPHETIKQLAIYVHSLGGGE